MTVTLVGGGPESVAGNDAVQVFAEECGRLGECHIGVVLAGDQSAAARFLPEYASVLPKSAGSLYPLPLDDVWPSTLRLAVEQMDGLIVGGGPTPAYHRALAGHSAVIRNRVRSGMPYLGFSAGAMVAAGTSIVGGHLSHGASVCPVESSEGLDEVSVLPGLGLVPWAVDVHAAQSGTIGRAIRVVTSGAASTAVAIDEGTSIVVDALDPQRVGLHGSGHTWWVDHLQDGTRVTPRSGRGRDQQ